MEKIGVRKRRSIVEEDAAEETSDGTRKGKSRRSKRKGREAARDLEEERRLTALLFGGGGDFSRGVALEDQVEEDTEPLEFEIDRTGDSAGGGDGDEANEPFAQNSTKRIGSKETDGSGPVWFDEDDAAVEVDLLKTSRLRKLRKTRTEEAASALSGAELEQRLRQRYQATTQRTARTDWAQIDENDETEEGGDEESVLQSSSASLLQSSTAQQRLPPNILKIVRCADANQVDPNQSVVQTVSFHSGSDPDRPLLLTAGLDKTLRFFQVGAEKSEKIHGIHFPKLPIYSASFLGTTGNVVVSGRRPFFYIYDAAAGKLDLVPQIIGREEKSLERCIASPDGRTIAFVGNDGYVILFDAHTKHWIADLKMNGSVRALTFTPDGEHLLGSGSDGDVYRWEMRSRRCIERFPNEDGTITCSLAASARHLAVGAESGVVNFYSEYSSNMTPGVLSSNRSPTRSIMNLHTSADMVRFNGDGQILAMSSRREKQGLKLLHVPSGTVFSNWPTSKTPLNYVWSMDFSPGSKFFAVGNDKGKCLLYRLLHYDSYSTS